jgi:hypothetical protein
MKNIVSFFSTQMTQIIRICADILNIKNLRKSVSSALSACLALVFAGCQPTLTAEFEDRPVVSCFLEAGASPVLTVSKLIAFRDDVEYSNEDINALSIVITDETDNETWQLQPVGEGKYENRQMVIQEGHTYRLDFTYNQKPVTATATIPVAPQNVAFSETSIGVVNWQFNPGEFTPGGNRDPERFNRTLDITWDNADKDYFLVKGFTTSEEPIRETQTDAPKTFALQHTQLDYATISQMQFSYTGNYEISVIRILPEYVIMSEGSATNLSTSIVDVKGNIDGGYGLFTAINRVTQVINVYLEEEDEGE